MRHLLIAKSNSRIEENINAKWLNNSYRKKGDAPEDRNVIAEIIYHRLQQNQNRKFDIFVLFNLHIDEYNTGDIGED